MRDETHRPSLGGSSLARTAAVRAEPAWIAAVLIGTGMPYSGSGLSRPSAPSLRLRAIGLRGGGRGPRREPLRTAGRTQSRRPGASAVHDGLYAALDLGTNNCRLLVARPPRAISAWWMRFRRIVRLGEGLTASGRLSAAAMGRAVGALEVCAGKITPGASPVCESSLRKPAAPPPMARNSAPPSPKRTGLVLEVVDRRTEAGLAAAGCAPLVDPTCEGAILFDIGGGSNRSGVAGPPGRRHDGPPRARIAPGPRCRWAWCRWPSATAG